jgi:hypothetical protein
LGKYKECLEDIEAALTFQYPENMRNNFPTSPNILCLHVMDIATIFKEEIENTTQREKF